MKTSRILLAMGGATLGLTLLTGCHIDMWIQPKVRDPQAASDFFSDGSTARHPVPNTVARGHFQDDDAYYTGVVNDKLVTTIPQKALDAFSGATEVERRKAMLLRGQDRFNIYCSPCHSRLGDGNGMIALRGLALRRPPGNYHTDRLRKMPIGHFYDVIVNGYGAMYSYAARVQEPSDRWAIAAYIRALQLSQNAKPEDAPAAERANLDHPGGAPTGSEPGEK